MLKTLFVYGGVMLLMFLFARVASLRVKTNITMRTCTPFWSWEIVGLIGVFIVFYGVRYDVGNDHLEYLEAYQTGLGLGRLEPIFSWITVSLKNLDVHFSVYFALLSFFQIYFILYSIRDERYLFPFLVLSLFMGQFFWHWMNGIRQDIAACIYVFAVQFIVDRKPWKFLLFIAIAMGFHKSSVLLLVTYPILCNGKDLTMNRFWQLVLLLSVGFLTIIHFDVLGRFLPVISVFTELLEFGQYSESMLQKFGEITTTGPGLYVFMLLDALIIWESVKMKAFYNTKRFTIYYNLYYWGMIFQLFLMNNMVLARPVRFFRCFKLLMIAYFLYYLYKHAWPRSNVLLFVVSMGLLVILFGAIVIGQPYYFFWDKI